LPAWRHNARGGTAGHPYRGEPVRTAL